MNPFFQRLMRETREPHEAVEATAFFKRMRDEILTLPEYTAHFRDLASARQTLEEGVFGTEVLAVIVGDGQRRYQGIAEDIEYLMHQCGMSQDLQHASSVAEVAEYLRELAQRNPVGLLGPLLALEGGVAMGGGRIAERMERRFPRLQQGGTRYFRGRGKPAEPVGFMEFAERIDVHTDDQQKGRIIAEAGNMFAYLAKVLHERDKLLHPRQSTHHHKPDVPDRNY